MIRIGHPWLIAGITFVVALVMAVVLFLASVTITRPFHLRVEGPVRVGGERYELVNVEITDRLPEYGSLADPQGRSAGPGATWVVVDMDTQLVADSMCRVDLVGRDGTRWQETHHAPPAQASTCAGLPPGQPYEGLLRFQYQIPTSYAEDLVGVGVVTPRMRILRIIEI